MIKAQQQKNNKDKFFQKYAKGTLHSHSTAFHSGLLTQHMRFARCTSLSHILLHSAPQNIAYTGTLSEIPLISQ